MTWFNPLYSKTVHWKVLKLQSTIRCIKLAMKALLKIRWSCMRNTDSIISSHNDSNSNPIRLLLVVNVESKMIAFLWGNALTLNIIYSADVTTNSNKIWNFTSAHQKPHSRNNTETTAEISNAKCIKKVLNWQNISGS